MNNKFTAGIGGDIMGKVRIFTNSSSDIAPKWAEEEGIILIPDMVLFGPEEQYRNNIDIDPPAMYKRLETAQTLPTTSHPNIAQYMEAFSTVEEEVLCICITSRMSGAYNTACTAAKLLMEQGRPNPITVVDSLQVSYGMALLVVEAARMAAAGADTAQICQMLEEKKQRVGVYFAMESLQNARKGGRIGAIRVLAADMLNVKPLLMFRDGLVRDYGVVRGFHTAVDRVIQRCCDCAVPGGEIYVFHADREELAEYVKSRLLAHDPTVRVRIGWVGTAIGIYTGAGCVGMACFEK